MPAASSRVANRPTCGKSGNSDPTPESMSTVRPPLRTTTTFSGHWNTSGGWSLSRSEEHTSELQSLRHLVCRLLLEKKKINNVAIKGWISVGHQLIVWLYGNHSR